MKEVVGYKTSFLLNLDVLYWFAIGWVLGLVAGGREKSHYPRLDEKKSKLSLLNDSANVEMR